MRIFVIMRVFILRFRGRCVMFVDEYSFFFPRRTLRWSDAKILATFKSFVRSMALQSSYGLVKNYLCHVRRAQTWKSKKASRLCRRLYNEIESKIIL